MQIITGFTGTNHITAEMDRDVNIGILGPKSYVLSVGKKMEAEVASNNEIKINDGVISHQGCAGVIKKNTYDSVTIMNGSQGMKRVDLIVLRYERNQDTGVESLDLEVVQGTPAESDPAIPEYTEGDIQAGDLVADMPLYKVELDGINIVAVEPLFQILMDMSTLNTDLAETIYDRSALPIADFYDATDFDLRKRGNVVFFNVSISMQSGTQFDPNTLYSIGPSAMLAELRPSKVYYLNGFGCDSNWGDSIAISVYVDASGYVRYSALSRKTYFKISGHWIAG